MTPEPPPQGSFCLTALKKRSHLLSEIKSRVIWSDSYSGLNHPWSESGYHESHGKGHQGFQSPPLRSARGRQRDCSSSGPLAESGSSAPLQRPTGIWSGAFFGSSHFLVKQGARWYPGRGQNWLVRRMQRSSLLNYRNRCQNLVGARRTHTRPHPHQVEPDQVPALQSAAYAAE